MKTCLVIGSLNMDYTIYLKEFPLCGETIYGKQRYIQPGGKGENQAVAIAKSHKVICNMIGAVGNDKDGEEIKKILKEYRVNDYLVTKIDSETGNAMICVDDSSENKIVIITGANGKLNVEDIDLNLIKNADYIILQNEISEEVNEYCIKKANEFNKIVVYNPAPYRKIKEELFPLIDYFMPNEVELEKYSGFSSLDESLNCLLNKGVKNIVVTLGTKGSLFKNKNKEIKVDAFKVKAIDTVAAGDTYVGYFVSSLASGLSIKESMEKASLASSITVSNKGSVISIPFGEEVYGK